MARDLLPTSDESLVLRLVEILRRRALLAAAAFAIVLAAATFAGRGVSCAVAGADAIRQAAMSTNGRTVIV